MKLESVRELKAELLGMPSALVASASATPAFSAFASNRVVAGRAMSDVALGVAVSAKKQYRLAVRPQRAGPLVSAMIEQVRNRARGETLKVDLER